VLVINKLTSAGKIKTVVIRVSNVVVRTIDGQEIFYRRDENVSTSSEGPLRRSSLH